MDTATGIRITVLAMLFSPLLMLLSALGFRRRKKHL